MLVAIIIARNYEMALFRFDDIMVGDDRGRWFAFGRTVISVIVVGGV